jgi:flagellar FliL protein
MPDEAGGIFPPEGKENAQPQEGDKGGASSKMMMIVVVVAAIVLAFAVSNFVVKPMLTKNKTAEVSDQPSAKEEKKDSSSHDSHGSAEGEAGDENFFKVEGIIVNPAATGGSRYLSTTIGFELEDPGSMEAFKSREIKIRDALISILSSKTVAELSNAESREMIRRQILKYINQICQPSKADAVYFVDFVLQ